jgi:protein tyrosine/serine phosphatase
MRALLLSLLAASALAQDAPRPEKFARPIESPGLPNFHEVTPQIFRSAQPWREGFQQLEKMGIRTVISLRDDGADDDWAAGTKLKLVRIPMNLFKVDAAAVAQVLALLQKKEDGPFLIHCQMGADRTGVVMAFWRITVQGWSREDAIAEMKACGCGIPDFMEYVAKADLTKLRAAK